MRAALPEWYEGLSRDYSIPKYVVLEAIKAGGKLHRLRDNYGVCTDYRNPGDDNKTWTSLGLKTSFVMALQLIMAVVSLFLLGHNVNPLLPFVCAVHRFCFLCRAPGQILIHPTNTHTPNPPNQC
jgi:hypothetical protein